MKPFTNNDFVVYIGTTNYLKSIGGVEKIIFYQCDDWKKRNVSVIYIYPLMLRENRPRTVLNCWGCIIDGQYIGVTSTNRLINYIFSMCGQRKIFRSIIIHHLLNTNMREVDKLLASSHTSVIIYFHDYFLLCRNFNLLKNGVEFCGWNPVSESKCSDCKFFYKTLKHKKQMLSFLERYKERINIIFPSDSALELFERFYPGNKNKREVVYHQQLIGEYTGNRSRLVEKQKIKIAFVGYKSYAKGWFDWKYVLMNLKKINQYELYQFGRTDEIIPHVTLVSVDYKETESAMIDALREYDIDCAVLWSLVPETYSYTFYECLASNILVITGKDSGNIKDQVEKRKNGVVLNDKEELLLLLSDTKKLRDIINSYRDMNVLGPDTLEQDKSYINKAMNLTNHYRVDNAPVKLSDRMAEEIYKKSFEKSR